MNAPTINSLKPEMRPLEKHEALVVNEFLKSEPKIELSTFEENFRYIQGGLPRLSLGSTLLLIKHRHEGGNLKAVIEVMASFKAQIEEALHGVEKFPMGFKPTKGANPAMVQELSLFFLQKSLQYPEVTPKFARDFLKDAFDMGMHDINDVPIVFRLIAEEHVSLSNMSEIHEKLQFKARAIGFGPPVKNSQAHFYDSALLGLYRQTKGLSLEQLQAEVSELMAVNTHMDTPSRVTAYLMEHLRDDKSQDKLQEALKLVRTKRKSVGNKDFYTFTVQ